MQAVAADNAPGGAGKRWQAVAINERFFGLEAESFDRTLHREHGRAKDVQAVDFRDRSPGNMPSPGAGEDLVAQLFAPLRQEELRILQATDGVGRIEYDRSGIDRP